MGGGGCTRLKAGSQSACVPLSHVVFSVAFGCLLKAEGVEELAAFGSCSRGRLRSDVELAYGPSDNLVDTEED